MVIFHLISHCFSFILNILNTAVLHFLSSKKYKSTGAWSEHVFGLNKIKLMKAKYLTKEEI